jgi:hypothetical protein
MPYRLRLPGLGQSKLRMQNQLTSFYVPRSESPDLLSFVEELMRESIGSWRTLLIVPMADVICRFENEPL